MKRILTIISALAAFAISASAYDGGIKAKVVNRSGRVQAVMIYFLWAGMMK